MEPCKRRLRRLHVCARGSNVALTSAFLNPRDASIRCVEARLGSRDLLGARSGLERVELGLRGGESPLSLSDGRLLALIGQAQDHLARRNRLAFHYEDFRDNPAGRHAESGVLDWRQDALRDDRAIGRRLALGGPLNLGRDCWGGRGRGLIAALLGKHHHHAEHQPGNDEDGHDGQSNLALLLHSILLVPTP